MTDINRQGLREAEIAEMEERATVTAQGLGDLAQDSSYAARASQHDVPALIKALRDSYNAGGGGGDFGHMLREALKSRIVSQAMGPEEKQVVELNDDVKVHSLAVSALSGDGRVYVDVRLLVGAPPPEGIG